MYISKTAKQELPSSSGNVKAFHRMAGSIRFNAVLFVCLVSLVVQIFIIGNRGDAWVFLADCLERTAKGIDDLIDMRSRGNQWRRQRDRVTG